MNQQQLNSPRINNQLQQLYRIKGYQQKSITFLYTNNEQVESEIKKIISKTKQNKKTHIIPLYYHLPKIK